VRGKELKGSVVSSNVIFISYHKDELNMEDLVLVYLDKPNRPSLPTAQLVQPHILDLYWTETQGIWRRFYQCDFFDPLLKDSDMLTTVALR
jgi:hypothetical protein